MNHEWLVTNGLGGYSSSTVTGVISRRYHGLLVAALAAPVGRMVVFNHISEFVRVGDGEAIPLDREGAIHGKKDGPEVLTTFRLDFGLPVWEYQVAGLVIEKRVRMLYRQNTVHVTYRLLESPGPGRPRLELRPALEFRPQVDAVDQAVPGPYRVSSIACRYEVSAPTADWLPPLRLRLIADHCDFSPADETINHVIYPSEEERGDPFRGKLWCPGAFLLSFADSDSATLIGSTEPWEIIDILSPEEADEAEKLRRERLIDRVKDEDLKTGFPAALVLAADQFISTPRGRLGESARAQAQGDEVRTVMAGYHWFMDWGRDTMISLEGLALLTGRLRDAKDILLTFSHYIRNGLIPNMIPDGKTEKGGLYNTADATLWYFHALSRYLHYTNDRMALRILLPKLVKIIEHHVRGTDFHIHVDPADGLLWQGEEGVQLTWMDAKAGDWVVTPRIGKAVEINALWYNALSLIADWLRESGDNAAADTHAAMAKQTADSFNAKFWNPDRGCLFDVIEGPKGNEPCIRPNQVFAISLTHPVLAQERWEPVLDVVKEKLLTPVGLRTLSPDDPAYQPTYHGDRLTRDGAYHQGTVWPWLIGPFIDAWLKLHPAGKADARNFLARFPHELNWAGTGTLSEVFDADEPHRPRGCIAQAWSVAEVLRAWANTR
jgi:predicted glycogen debranching enzyme